MKKQIILALAISISAFSFAQKKELKTVEKAIKNNNFSEAKSALKTVEPMLGSMDPKLVDKYNYLMGVALYANGSGTIAETDEALKFLNKVESGYKVEIATLNDDMAKKLLEKGNAAYEDKKYGPASEYFERLYSLRKKDTVYLYYAAATAVNVPDYDRALRLYEELKDLKYTGITEQLFAVNIKTGEKEQFPSEALRKASISTKTHNNPTTEKTTSKRGEIIKNVALIYISQENSDKAIAAIKDARAEDPDDVNLILSEANIYYKLGDNAKFKELLQVATEKDPGNAELQYNLGVISAESKQIEEAKAYYEKAIELDPNYANAYINMAALLLEDVQAIVEEMNALGNSSADYKKYDELKEVTHGMYKNAIPYLQKALELRPQNDSAATTLMNIYSVLGETEKYKEMKAKVDAMGAGN